MLAALDLGGTKLEVGLVDEGGSVAERMRIATGDESPKDVFENAGEFFAGKEYRAVGLASFEPLAGDGLSMTTPKKLWRGFDLRRAMEKAGIVKKGMVCEIVQDVQGEVVAEARLGGHGDFGLYAYATISTGIGVAFFDARRNYLYRAAEGGHVPVPMSGGQRGSCESHESCWEGACSGTALGVKPTGQDLVVTDEWVRQMACAVYTCHLVANVDCFVLGGGVMDGIGGKQGEVVRRIALEMEKMNRGYVKLPRVAAATVKSRALLGVAQWVRTLHRVG